jgi:hypothetical protein
VPVAALPLDGARRLEERRERRGSREAIEPAVQRIAALGVVQKASAQVTPRFLDKG